MNKNKSKTKQLQLISADFLAGADATKLNSIVLKPATISSDLEIYRTCK